MVGGGDSAYPTVSMLHGFGADKDEGGKMFGRLAEYLGVAGVASLPIDFAAAGDSEQPWIENDFDGMVADAIAVLDWLSTHESVDADRLGVHGWSVSGRVSATVAGSDGCVQILSLWAGSVQDGTDGMEPFFEAPTRRRCGSLYDCARIEGSVLFDPFGTGPFELSLAWFDAMAASQALTVVRDFEGPLLAIHGEDDDVVLPSVSRNLIAESGSYDATLRVIPGSDHTHGVYVDPHNDIAEEVLIITGHWIEAGTQKDTPTRTCPTVTSGLPATASNLPNPEAPTRSTPTETVEGAHVADPGPTGRRMLSVEPVRFSRGVSANSGGLPMHSGFRACLVIVAALIVGSVAACTNDPTASLEYTELEEELATAESALINAEGRLAQLSRELESTVAKAAGGEDLQAVQQAWLEAWNTGDGDGVLSMMAPGGRHYCPGSGTQGLSGSDLSAFVEHGYVMTDAKVVSVVCTHVPGDPAIVANDCLVVTEGTLNEHPGYTTVLHLRGREGSPRVVDHHAYP